MSSGDPRGGLAADACRAHEDDAIPREQGLGVGAELLERDAARAGQVTARPFAWVAHVDHVDLAAGDELVSLLGSD